MKLVEAVGAFMDGLDGVKAKTTKRWYKPRLDSLVEFLGEGALVAEITTEQLRAWRSALVNRETRFEAHPMRPVEAGGLSAYTLHGYVRACRALFRWLVAEEKICRSPAQRLELPPLPSAGKKGISEEDMRRIVLEATKEGPMARALVLFLASTACRVAGAAGLLLDDLEELDAGKASVREKGRGGNRKGRTVYLSPAAVAAMKAWLEVRPKDKGDHVFIGHQVELTESGIYQLLERLARAAGVTKNWNPHSWRHGAARAMIKRGMPLAQVKQLLGHSTIKVTADFYGEFDDSDLKAAHAAYNWLDGDGKGDKSG